MLRGFTNSSDYRQARTLYSLRPLFGHNPKDRVEDFGRLATRMVPIRQRGAHRQPSKPGLLAGCCEECKTRAGGRNDGRKRPMSRRPFVPTLKNALPLIGRQYCRFYESGRGAMGLLA